MKKNEMKSDNHESVVLDSDVEMSKNLVRCILNALPTVDDRTLHHFRRTLDFAVWVDQDYHKVLQAIMDEIRQREYERRTQVKIPVEYHQLKPNTETLSDEEVETEEEKKIEIKRVADLINPTYIDKAKTIYENEILPLVAVATPCDDFEQVTGFLMNLGAARAGRTNRTNKSDVYQAFGKLRPFIRPDISESDVATYLAKHVSGMSSVSAWLRNI